MDSLDSLALAGQLCTPISGVFDAEAPMAEAHELFDSGEVGYTEQIVVVTRAGLPIGYLTGDDFLHHFFAVEFGHTSEEGVPPQNMGALAHAFDKEIVIESDVRFTDVLAFAAAGQKEVLVVRSGMQPVGSISVHDVLKPPAMVYLLCLSFELEASALELCSLFPGSWESLSADRQAAANKQHAMSKQRRREELKNFYEEMEIKPAQSVIYREWLQTTMFCDKKTMLLKADLGLKGVSNAEIKRSFEFFERIRNYVAHPSAAFTRSLLAAEELDAENHEQVSKENESSTPFSMPLASELNVDGLASIAKAVKECRDVIRAIENSIVRSS